VFYLFLLCLYFSDKKKGKKEEKANEKEGEKKEKKMNNIS